MVALICFEPWLSCNGKRVAARAASTSRKARAARAARRARPRAPGGAAIKEPERKHQKKQQQHKSGKSSESLQTNAIAYALTRPLRGLAGRLELGAFRARACGVFQVFLYRSLRGGSAAKAASLAGKSCRKHAVHKQATNVEAKTSAKRSNMEPKLATFRSQIDPTSTNTK